MRTAILVGYTRGSWDDFSECEVFATEDEQKAKDWVRKFDELLYKLKETKVEPYMDMWKNYGYEGEEGSFSSLPWPIQKQFLFLKEINGAYMTSIELR